MADKECITCIIRQKPVALTQEERERQRLIKWLLRERGYQSDDMSLEYTFPTGSTDTRADIAIWHPTDYIGERHTLQNVYIVVECKRANVSESKYRQALGQLQSYLNQTQNAFWGVLFAGPERCDVMQLRNRQEGRLKRRVYIHMPGGLEAFPHAETPAPAQRTMRGALPTYYAPATPRVLLVYRGVPYQVVAGKRFTIGRESSDLTINDRNVSQQHAIVEYVEGCFWIVDCKSTNGLMHNDRRIDRRAIAEGDLFSICDHELRFTYR